MKKFKLAIGLSLLATFTQAAPPEAMFSPYEGVEAFQRMYDNVEGAKDTAHISIYSWSDTGITKAMTSLLENNPKVKLRVVLHRPLAKKADTLEKVAKLEKLGAMFKMAKMNMHEKTILVDSKKLVNSSANMSGGAKTKYSEDFIFIDSDGEKDNEALIKNFNREFAILWNTSEDIITKDEKYKADTLKLNLNANNKAINSDSMTLHTSSMNFTLKKNKTTSVDYKKGKSVKLIKIKNEKGEQPYAVSSALINAIDNAKESIDLSLNHFNLYSVSQALIRAVKRGVVIKLAADNQEFKTKIRDEGRKSIEMTPRFIRDWKKLPGNKNKVAPVRIKFYSHAPHYTSWFLNHHKYVIIDIDAKKPVLFAGSFNLSKNAEFNQFDNLIEFKGDKYAPLMRSYSDNHTKIWNLNRTKDDKPKKAALAYYTKVYEGSHIRLHAESSKNAISLTWGEAIKLKKAFGKIAPGIFRGLFQKKACTFYDIKTKLFYGGRSCE